MGTRADFYVGKGKDAEWIGSIAWDGYRDGISGYVLKAKTEANFRKAAEAFFAERDDVTLPTQGWPWPWDTSDTTDCSYWFFDGQTWEAHSDDNMIERYVSCWVDPNEDGEFDLSKCDRIEFPDMSAKKNVVHAGNRSGLIVLSVKP